MRQNNTRKIALGGMLAAVAVVIMSLGGFIPIATYICPMLCCLTQFLVLCFCGKKIGWCWFAVVSFLVLIMSPDKEAVMVFIAVGYYPMLKPIFERYKFAIVLKLLFFNASIVTANTIMIYLLGMQHVATENLELGIAGLVIILLLGNLTFYLLDRLLSIMAGKMR